MNAEAKAIRVGTHVLQRCLANCAALYCICVGANQQDEAGMRSFIVRAITAAEKKFQNEMMQAAVPAISAAATPATDVGALGLLVGAITKSQHNVHVDLAAKISASLPCLAPKSIFK